MIMEDDDDDDDEDEAVDNLRTNIADDADAEEEEGDGGLKVQEIDAYWLQRRLSQAMQGLDAAGAQELAARVASALQEAEAAAAETKVVQLLGLDHFELAKELLRNRLKIVWVMKLRQAQVGGAAQRNGRV